MMDLFQRLRITQGESQTQAARIDVGWAAWRSRQPLPDARWRDRLRFWLALWRHFGQARYLVQVDDCYQTASSVRVRQRQEGGIEVLLLQTDNIWQCLLGRWLQRAGQPSPAWRRLLAGQRVVLSRHPQDLADASLPRLPVREGQPVICPEVVLDLQRPAHLPLCIEAA